MYIYTYVYIYIYVAYMRIHTESTLHAPDLQRPGPTVEAVQEILEGLPLVAQVLPQMVGGSEPAPTHRPMPYAFFGVYTHVYIYIYIYYIYVYMYTHICVHLYPVT